MLIPKESLKDISIENDEITLMNDELTSHILLQVWKPTDEQVRRRTFVTMLFLWGENYTIISRYSGHNSLKMVRRYDKSKDDTKIRD